MEMQLADRGKEAKGFHSARTHAVERDGIKPGTLERIKIAAFAGFVGFLIGFVPAWFTSTGYQEELDSVVRTLRPSVLQNDLATATINARRGEYEQARQQASSFFTDLRNELERNESSFAPPQQKTVRSILEKRDETITLLARRDSKGADLLSTLYFSYLQMKNAAVPENK